MAKGTGTLRKTMVALTAIVLLLSIILCIHSISGHGLIGCTQGTNCNIVLGSRWSFLFGIIPVSALAAGAYLTLLSCILLIDSKWIGQQERDFLFHAILVVSGAIVGCAIWFIWLQSHMIRAFCPYCMTAHILGIAISVLSVIWCIGQKTRRVVLNILIGILIAAALAVVQFTTTPRSLAERGFVNEPLRYPDPKEMPIIGSPDAKHKVTMLFDWQCAHCRRTHIMLPDAVSLLGDSIAIVCTPVSMSRECNPHISPGIDRFASSCTFMRIGLAIWRTNPDAYWEYENQFFGTDLVQSWNPPTVEQATAMAEQLIGKDRLEKSMQSRWMENYIWTVNELFGRTSKGTTSAIPRLIYNGKIMIPEADNPSALASLIREMVQ
ncbi:MAG: hypothetical protein IKO33_02150 [Bacteroidaceae bacterium]|nr:hypothetical protein [Bacteroidaceae bacterium]